MSVGKPLRIFGDPVDEGALRQIENCLRDERAVAAALMADHHLGYSMPIGGVVAYEDAISPSGVGFDIACGNKAVRTNLLAADVGETKPLLREIQKRVAFGVGRSNQTPVDHPLFDDPVWSELEPLSPGLREKAQAQLGTVGSGNHYVDLLVDAQGRLWVANHFGSRGLGHTIATGFLNLGKGAGFGERLVESEEPTVLDVHSEAGTLYVVAMRLAGEYAYAGRDYVIDQVLELLGAEAVESVHNHHNFAWLEDGRWVVRKGATPLTREPAFIGGSMGDASVIVRGTGDEIGALASAPHGAGRQLSRTAAAGKLRKMWACSDRDCGFQQRALGGEPPPEHPHPLRKVKTRDKSTAAIDWDTVRADLTSRGITVLGAGADEAPGAYKSLGDVLSHHRNLDVVEVLEPLGVVMAAPDEFDPYKD